MKKYFIEVGGKGGECYIHKITDEQKELLKDVESDSLEFDEISKILNLNDVFETDDIVLGVYPSSTFITVKNENGDVIWESPNDFEYEENEWNYIFETDQCLIAEDYCKGHFFTYEIDLDEDFDYKKLKPVITEISERIEIITDLIYNNVDLSPFKEYGDYWSKGFTYYLN